MRAEAERGAAIRGNPRYTRAAGVEPAAHRRRPEPAGWVISHEGTYPAPVSEAYFIAVQDASARRDLAGRRYLLAGLLLRSEFGTAHSIAGQLVVSPIERHTS